MAGNLFGKMAADTLGLSNIGKIISPKDFDKVDGDDYLININGNREVKKKRLVKRNKF